MAQSTDAKKTRRTTKKAEPAKSASPTAQAAVQFDRSQLGASVRVYALAKQIGIPSKDVIAALADMGERKVAQSSLTRDDALRVLDALAPAPVEKQEPVKKKTTRKATKKAVEQPEEAPVEEEKPARKRATRKATKKTTRVAEPAPEVEPEAVEEDDKLRERIRKNVDNEIHQIEEKVEAELGDDLPLEDVASDVTPAPEREAAHSPLFVAPGADAEESSNRKGRRRSARKTAEPQVEDEPEQIDEPVAIKGSTRLEAQRRRRTEMRETGRTKKHIVSQAEFLARRESVERTMVVRERPRHDGGGMLTQVGVLEDDLLVEHFVTTEAQASMIGNIYLGRVQNVLPSMEAAFIDIGTGRNGVLYSTEVDWKITGGRGRRIEQALKSGDQVLVQVSKDPLGHKGPRLTTQISLPGRFLVYVPGGRSAGISRKLPAPERKRLKDILGRVIPGKGGAIIRTAAENVPEEAIAADVRRLHNLWESVQERAEKEKQSKGATPVTLYEEPDMLVKVVRDLFNEDFASLVIDGRRSWSTVHSYVKSVAPDLADRLVKYDRSEHDGKDAFEHYRIDEQIQKALGRKVWLPSGGYLIIDRTEAMVVVDVNTGKFTGAGGNLEETVTRNNLEAAEEIVRQMRLRDLGGMIVVDFIDMVLPENQDLVLRRLKEALGRDHTRHQVSEVTSLGLVQMTRKRIGTGLVETFTTECEHCGGTGLIFHEDPVDEHEHVSHHAKAEVPRAPRQEKKRDDDSFEHIADSIVHVEETEESDAEKRPSKRRGRRGGGRGRGGRNNAENSQPQEESLNEWERIAAEAVETARELDPEEPSDADYVSEEKSFTKAVEEFDASPRRKRRTRGNSKSDHRPTREEHESNEPNEVAQPQRETGDDAVTPPAEEAPKKRASRGRRRAVRRSQREEQAAAEEVATEGTKEKVEKGVDKQPKSNAASRGRRRATRRTSSRG